MGLLDYIDTEKTTIAILKDWRDQEWRRENTGRTLRSINDRMTALNGFNDATPVQGGGNKREEMLCGLIDKKTVAMHGYEMAKEYFAEIERCWRQLTDDERFLLECRFIDGKDAGGIHRIMERFCVEKSRAYELSNAALTRLSKLLFW